MSLHSWFCFACSLTSLYRPRNPCTPTGAPPIRRDKKKKNGVVFPAPSSPLSSNNGVSMPSYMVKHDPASAYQAPDRYSEQPVVNGMGDITAGAAASPGVRTNKTRGFLGSPPAKEGPCRRFVSSAWFNNVVIFVIVLNTIVLAMDHHPIDPMLERVLEICNFVFTIFFAFEMIFKILGLGLREYVKYVCSLALALARL